MHAAAHERLEAVMRCALARTRGMKEAARMVVVGKAGARWLKEQGLTEGGEVRLYAPDDPSHLVQTLEGPRGGHPSGRGPGRVPGQGRSSRAIRTHQVLTAPPGLAANRYLQQKLRPCRDQAAALVHLRATTSLLSMRLPALASSPAHDIMRLPRDHPPVCSWRCATHRRHKLREASIVWASELCFTLVCGHQVQGVFRGVWGYTPAQVQKGLATDQIELDRLQRCYLCGDAEREKEG